MSKIVAISPEVPGHMFPTIAILRELQSRGHEVSMIGNSKGIEFAEKGAVSYHNILDDSATLDRLAKQMELMGTKSSRIALKATGDYAVEVAKIYLASLPLALKELQPDLILNDQTYICSAAVAEVLKIPYFTICAALNFVPALSSPPVYFNWHHKKGPFARVRNLFGHAYWQSAFIRYLIVVNHYLRQHGCPLFIGPIAGQSKRLIISQAVDEFDFSPKNIPQMVNVGPLVGERELEQKIDFPFEHLEGKDFAYISFGTIQERGSEMLEIAANACYRVGLNSVVATGSKCKLNRSNLLGDPIVVPFAPQLKLLQSASLLVTHAGMNTTMEGLSNGVPIVAVPMTHDQPGVAARIEYSGCGVALPLHRFSSAKMQSAVEQVSKDNLYKENARKMSGYIRDAGGLGRAADLIEAELQNY